MLKQLLLMYFCCWRVATGQAQDYKYNDRGDSALNRKLTMKSELLLHLATSGQNDSARQAIVNHLQNLDGQDSQQVISLVRTLQALKVVDSARRRLALGRIDSIRYHEQGFPVSPFGKTLFTVFSPQGASSPQERAAIISSNLSRLAKQEAFEPDSLIVTQSGGLWQLDYRRLPVLSIDTTDALWAHKTRIQVALTASRLIATAILSRQSVTSLPNLLREAGFSILIITLVVVFSFLLIRVFRVLGLRLRAQQGMRIKAVKIRNYELLDAGALVRVLLFIINLFKWALLILLVYLALPLLFGLFPWTRGLASKLFGYILNPAKKIFHAFVDYLPNLFTVLMIAAAFWYLLKAIKYMKREVETGHLTLPGFYKDWAAPTYQIIRVVVLAFMLILIFPYLPGSNSLAFKGVSVFLGVLFTFGSAGPLGNLISGLVLTYMRSFKVGDRVKIGEVTGDILEETLLVIRIKTIKNEIISIPNSTVLSSPTINYSSESTQDGLVINATITMSYSTPWRQVHELLILAAAQTCFIEPAPAPYVLQTGLDDYYVSYQINAFTRQPNQQAVIYSNLYQHIQDQFNSAGLQLLSPHYRVIKTEQ